MDRGIKGRALAALIVAKVICCAGLVLLATGALGGLGAWFMDDGVIWLGAGFAVVAGALLSLRGRLKKSTDSQLNSRHESSIEHRRRVSSPPPAR